MFAPQGPGLVKAFSVCLATPLVLATAALSPAAAVSEDPLAAEQWGLAQIRADEAWSEGTAESVVIAIVDSGVDAGHPDLAPVLQPGIDLVDGDSEPDDPNGHGTHVAGIAAAAVGNDTGIAGVAKGARILPVRVLDAAGNGDPGTIADGIMWAADNGAQVINLSLADVGLGDRLFKGGPINTAVRAAAARGVTVVAAAGNDAEFSRAYRARVPVLVVNAAGPGGEPADFTAFGDPRAVAAPGVDILSTAPAAPTTAWPDGTGGYARLDGTSMAAPHAAGVAALLAARGVTGADAINRIIATATPGDDPRLGAGLVNAAAAVSGLPAPEPPTATPDGRPSAPVSSPPSPDGQPSTPAEPGATPPPVEQAESAPPEESGNRWPVLALIAAAAIGVTVAVARRRRGPG